MMENESETIQKKLYFLTKNLKDMHQNLRSYEIQSRISLESLTMIGELLSQCKSLIRVSNIAKI